MYDFKAFQFSHGSHDSRDKGMCVMEAVAYVAGEAHSDHPKCACPVITAFLISWNDALPSDAERNRLLSRFVFRLPGTRATPEIEQRRSFMALDWLVRTHTPAWLDLRPELAAHAKALRSLKRIKDMETALEAGKVVQAAWDAARDAAGDAAWAAAGDAAGDAARDAARDAAGAAAGAAAWDAAWDAAGTAARDAARDVIKPTQSKLQRSAQRLVDRMIRLTEVREPKCMAQCKVQTVEA
jgi:hypothetical protein